MIRSAILICAFLLVICPVMAQQPDWVKKPKDQWPQIAMINEVWYKNGERYVHPSFEYVATGFLIDVGTDTLAATVKHALWVAKMKSMNTVNLTGLQRWIMRPKGNLKDSVVMDNLINTDTTEILKGPQSSITQRDWLVFTTKFVSSAIQPLKPRYSRMKAGETLYFTGCPYSEKTCLTHEAKVLEIEGNRIIFTMPENLNLGGFSGSPLIDKDGYLVGILGGSSFDRRTGGPALYGISTQYLRDVLNHKHPLNVRLIPINVSINSIIEQRGFNAGIKELKRLIEIDSSHLRYDFSMENINSIGDSLVKAGKIKWAMEVYKMSSDRFQTTANYLKLANGYVLSGQTKQAKATYHQILERWPGNKEATEALDKLLNKK